MDSNNNAINWFEIPALDISRAKKFYETVLSIEMAENEMMGMKMAFFPFEEGSGKATGSLVQGEMHKPSAYGSVLYLNANPDLSSALDKVEGAGGIVVTPKTQITEEIGYMAFFMDSEGNKIALHSQK